MDVSADAVEDFIRLGSSLRASRTASSPNKANRRDAGTEINRENGKLVILLEDGLMTKRHTTVVFSRKTYATGRWRTCTLHREIGRSLIASLKVP